MTEPILRHVDIQQGQGLRRTAVWDWAGPHPGAPVAVCVHGLTRQGRDFDSLARSLIATHRVLCPDIAGRGASDWLADPAGYQVPTYAADVFAMLGAWQLRTVDWVGTSMGGLIGMVVASLPGTPIRRLVLNDVGPTIEADAIARIAAYVGEFMDFDSVAHASEALWHISRGFGPHSPEAWLALTRPQLRVSDDGRCRLHYDPAIAVPLRGITVEGAAAAQVQLWQCYDAIRAPTLLLRGAESDLLSADTARAMQGRGPHARVIEFEGVGHAPTLVARDQIETVVAFLRDGVGWE
jgi:pimeloyl-ACP methyl ester carboxylesterase